jgi:hypothetical protein
MRVNFTGWQVLGKPAKSGAIERLRMWTPFALPADYFELLRVTDGGEGPLAIDPGWFQLWRTEEIPEHYRGYATAEYFPEYLGFGSSGGGVMLAFKEGAGAKVFGIDFCNSDPNDIWVIADDFQTFVSSMGDKAQQTVQPDRA